MRCRPLEHLIAKQQKEKRDTCHKHATKKFYFCKQCKEAFCPMCLLEDGDHEGHPRQNLKDLCIPVIDRLGEINEGLSAKRRQIEQSAEEI